MLHVRKYAQQTGSFIAKLEKQFSWGFFLLKIKQTPKFCIISPPQTQTVAITFTKIITELIITNTGSMAT